VPLGQLAPLGHILAMLKPDTAHGPGLMLLHAHTHTHTYTSIVLFLDDLAVMFCLQPKQCLHAHALPTKLYKHIKLVRSSHALAGNCTHLHNFPCYDTQTHTHTHHITSHALARVPYRSTQPHSKARTWRCSPPSAAAPPPTAALPPSTAAAKAMQHIHMSVWTCTCTASMYLPTCC